MADRSITALTAATSLNSSDLFVLSQSNQAKSATWQLIISYLTTALDGHGGIQTIEKTSTSGLVDTYTVTLADLTTYSFTVTNAKSIASITKTPAVPPSLTDTYTITYNDGDTDTFTMDNGRGISSITKTSAVPPSLTDTYVITYNDGTTYQFTIDNGKSIASITDKWAVSDDNTTEPETWYETLQTMTPVNRYLWHYQVITFNDASTLDTDAAVVGVYGDTGQNWYVHIKYSSARPTQDSDMGDIPDDWIGIYSGTSSTAPTSYTSYSWFQYKGEKGDTGDASAITSQSVTYMEGNSGTVVPSGSWSPSIPPVAQGNYLWTRTILNFNDGSTVTSYSVARMGVDGSGSVSTVNNVSPDGNGNVALDADDIPTDDNTSVQARVNGVEDSIEKHDADLAVAYDPTSTYAVGDFCVYGNQLYRCITAVSVPDTFDPLKWEEVSVTGLTGELKNTLNQLVRPNLLDNWYFGNPVNQRGNLIYSNAGYTIDRWSINAGTLSIQAGDIEIGADISFYQVMENAPFGKLVTATILTTSGELITGSGVIPSSGSVTFAYDGNRYSIYYLNGSIAVETYNTAFTLVAVKLELGSGQTLAHQENGNWVLNEIPDYDEQLYRCCASTADPSDTYANKPYNAKADEASLALRRSGATNTEAQIENGTYFYLDGTLKRAIATIAQNASFTAQNCETVTAGGLNSLSEFETINVISNTGYFTIQHNNSWRYGHYVHIEFDGFLSTSYSEDNDLAGIRKCLPASVIRGIVVITTTNSVLGMSGILNNADGNIKQRLTSTAPANSSIYFCFDYVL